MENGTGQNLYDIIFPDGSPGLAAYIFIGLVVSLTAIIVLYLFYAVVLKKLFSPEQKPSKHIQEPRAAQQHALEELRQLQGAAGQSGSVDAREYAYELSKILKTYISTIYNCNALHSSYAEIMQKVPQEQQETVAGLVHEIYKIEFTPESAQVPALLHICELTERYIIHSCN